MSSYEAARAATAEIGMAVMATTLSPSLFSSRTFCPASPDVFSIIWTDSGVAVLVSLLSRLP